MNLFLAAVPSISSKRNLSIHNEREQAAQDEHGENNAFIMVESCAWWPVEVVNTVTLLQESGLDTFTIQC